MLLDNESISLEIIIQKELLLKQKPKLFVHIIDFGQIVIVEQIQHHHYHLEDLNFRD